MKRIAAYILLLCLFSLNALAMFCNNDPVNKTDPLGLAPGEGGGNPITMGPSFDFYPRSGWGGGQLDFEQRTMSGFAVVDKVTKPIQYYTMAGGAVVAVVYGGPPVWAAVSDMSLNAVILASSSKAVGYGLTALAGYHLYNIATDPDYAGATMSIDAGTGVSSIYLAGRDLFQAGSVGARALAAGLPRLNPANYQMRMLPGFGMNLGNISLAYQPRGPTVRLWHGTTQQRALSMLRQGPDPRFIEPGGGPPAGGISMAEAQGPYARGFNPLDYARGKAAAFPQEGGAVILEIEVPAELAADAYALAEFRFEKGEKSLDELLRLWPNLPKKIIPVK